MLAMRIQEAKERLDHIIAISRVHLYKPIQIAEILNRHRTGNPSFDLTNLDQYRNRSKEWRDLISMRLVGNVSTSSQKYQDNLFEDNAIPREAIVALDAVLQLSLIVLGVVGAATGAVIIFLAAGKKHA